MQESERNGTTHLDGSALGKAERMKEWNWKRRQEVWDHDVKSLSLFSKIHQRLWIHSISSYSFTELLLCLSACSLTWRKHHPSKSLFQPEKRKKFSAYLALNSFGNQWFIKIACFQEPARSADFFAALATELWKRDNSNASERAFPCFLAVFLVLNSFKREAF